MRTALILFFSLFFASAQAAQISDLLVGEVEVDGRDNQQLNAGIKAALEQVLVRVTGDNSAPYQPQGKAIIRQARQVMLSYGFESGDQLRLKVRFDHQQLKKRLQQASLPIWGIQRPTTIHWLAVESEQLGTQLQTDLDASGEISAKIAERRGLPQLLPILDLEDNMNVDVNDIIGNFPQPVLTASERYGSDFVLFSYVAKDGELWQYKTHLYAGRSGADSSHSSIVNTQRALLTRQGSAPTQEGALEAIMAEVGYYYSQRYAAITSGEQGNSQIEFTIDGGIATLVELERYLTTLAPVQATQVVAVNGQQVTIELALIGGLAELEQLMTLESRLVRIEELEQLDGPIRYRWQ